LKRLVFVLSLLIVCLATTSAPAQNDIYDNGPTDGQTLAWPINFGLAVSDTFTVSTPSTINALNFAVWLFPGDVLETAEVSITSSEFGGTTYLDQTVSFTASGCFRNTDDYDVCNEMGSFHGVNLNAGTYWLSLQNAVVNSGNEVFWDQNGGPSFASNNTIGTLPSESFTMLGHQGSGTGTTPEPVSILLCGSGVLGLAGVLRRKKFRLLETYRPIKLSKEKRRIF
jgi:hypothetical protein